MASLRTASSYGSSYHTMDGSIEDVGDMQRGGSYPGIQDVRSDMLLSNTENAPTETTSLLGTKSIQALQSSLLSRNRTASASSFLLSRSIVLSSSRSAARRATVTSDTYSLPDRPATDRQASTLAASCSSMCMILGLVIFTLPALAAKGGITIVILAVVLGVQAWYTSKLLLDCQHQRSRSMHGVNKRVYENYVEIGSAAVQPYGDIIMKILILTSSAADIYTLIFCAQVSLDLLKNIVGISRQSWIVIWGVVAVPLCLIRRMSTLAWFGIFAMALYAITLVASLIVICVENKIWSFKDLLHVDFTWEMFFVSYGIIANSYALHLAVPAIEGSMRDEREAPNMFLGVFSINITLKAIFMLAGALAFGAGSMETITSNFGDYFYLSPAINICLAVYLVFELPLITFVVFETLDFTFLPHFPLFSSSACGERCWLVLSRLTLLTALVFVAVCAPKLDLILSLVGNIRGVLISFIFPLFFYIQLKFRRTHLLVIIVHGLLTAINALAGAAGIFFAVKGLTSS